MRERGYLRRRLINKLMLGLCTLAALAALLPLLSVLGYVIVKGLPVLNLQFLTANPKPLGEAGGGVANAIVGTLILLGIAALVGLPVGLFSGIYLAEYGGRLAVAVRFLAEVLAGIPSITIGVFVFALVVRPMGTFSAIAGGIALGIIMVPIITRTTEEMLRLVPVSVREAAWALGVRRWRVITSVVLPTALGGITTGIVLALARAAGETAPLLFTALGNRFWSLGLTEPIAALPLQIFTYALTPYRELQAQAWGSALVLVAMVLILSIAARFLGRRYIT